MSVGAWLPPPPQLPVLDLYVVGHLVEQAARRVPHKAAVVTSAGTLTYLELRASALAGAACLMRSGVRRGDRVVVSVAEPGAAVVWLFAVLAAGAAFVLVAPDSPAEALRHVADDAEARAAVLDPDDARGAGLSAWTRQVAAAGYRDRRAAEPPAGIATDVACLIYTSGSTGRPKGVICPHRAMVFAVEAVSRVLCLRPTDVIGSILPLTFDYGLYQVFLALRATATVVLGVGADTTRIGSFIARHGVTVLPVVPSLGERIARVLTRQPDQARGVRLVTSTGERLGEAVADRLRRACPAADVLPMYGLTECKRVAIATATDVREAPRSVGRPLPGTEVSIVDPLGGRPLPAGVSGEIVVRGPHVMAGYHRAPALTATRFRPFEPGGDLALFTGDRGHLDDAGRLYVEGRADDQFKVAGTRVSAGEVEHAARAVPGVTEATVLPPAGGHRYTLAVTVDAGAGTNAEGIAARLRELLDPAKIPEQVVVLDEWPTTRHGKRDLTAVRRSLDEAAGGPR